MILSRRELLAGSAGAAVLAAAAPIARAADDFPSRPLRIIVGYPPGGTTDYAARILAEGLATRIGQKVLVENKPGADSQIGIEYVVKSPADGYTMVLVGEDVSAMAAALRAHPAFDLRKDFTYIGRIVELSYMVVVSTKLPVKTMKELVEYAKAHPGQLRYGSAGVGSASHVAGILLMQKTGFTMVHVPYRGSGPAMTDLAGGFTDLGIQSMATIGGAVEGGKVRLLATTGEARDPLAPDVPTMVEAGFPDAGTLNWLGLLAPTGVPQAVQDKLDHAIADVMNDKETQARYLKLGQKPAPLMGEDFRKLVMTKYAQWKGVAESAHLTIE